MSTTEQIGRKMPRGSGPTPVGWLLLLDALAVVALGIAAQMLWKPGAPGPLAAWVAKLPHGDRLSLLGGFCVAALLIATVHGLIRFVMDDDTHAGIVTGLLLIFVVLWDWRSLVPIVVMVLAGAEVTRRRSRGERGAGLATIYLLAFPTAATLLCLIFLDWRFNS